MNSKRFFQMALVLFIILGAIYFTNANVQTRSYYTKELKFNITEGQRMVIISKDYESIRITVRPTTAKIYDYKVPKGKKITGILREK